MKFIKLKSPEFRIGSIAAKCMKNPQDLSITLQQKRVALNRKSIDNRLSRSMVSPLSGVHCRWLFFWPPCISRDPSGNNGETTALIKSFRCECTRMSLQFSFHFFFVFIVRVSRKSGERQRACLLNDRATFNKKGKAKAASRS